MVFCIALAIGGLTGPIKPEPSMRKFVAFKSVALICLALSFLAAAPALAEIWPSRLIKATIPFGAGSATDVVPRLVFDRLAAELGEPIVIENRAGAGGTLGTALVAKADPDGYSVLAHSSALTIAPAIFPNLAFDVTRDLASVLMIGLKRQCDDRADLAALEDRAGFHRRRQGKTRLDFVRLGRHRQRGAYQRREIPPCRRHRGDACALSRRRGSHHRHPGRPARFLFLSARNRAAIDPGRPGARFWCRHESAPDLPEVPTPAEAGLKSAESLIWFGVFMPARTPHEIVEKFHAAGIKVLNDPVIAGSLKKLGVEAMPMTPAQMDQFVKAETASNL
jgi:hypothetical protein